MDHKEIGINKRNWVDLAQGRDYRRALVNAVSFVFHKPWCMLCVVFRVVKYTKSFSIILHLSFCHYDAWKCIWDGSFQYIVV